MCGIAGVLYTEPSRPVEPATLRAMGDAIAHRGPDGEGFWQSPGIGLVHRRLSIIDLAGGAQPLGNEDGRVQVVFNGEIYNYPELRRELIARGHRFATNSDTEVLVHMYEELGERLVERLRGMFALAIWDVRQQRLLLARDRVGLKPLYVYRDTEKLLFGSELKAILAHPGVDRAIDPRAVEDYLALGLVPGARSIFKRVVKLPAAHTWLLAAGRWDHEPRRYWRLSLEPRERSVEDWLADLESKLDETVAAHRLADVPVGAFLSGGLDSSAIVASVARDPAAALQTFSIGFAEDAYNELPFARQVASRFGTRHVEQIVTAEGAGALDDLVHFYDEPFADPSAIPTLAVSRLARQAVKVVLSGDGGDEALGGYSRYAHDLAEARLRNRLPGWFRHGVLGPLAAQWPKADWLPRFLRAKTRLENLSREADSAYANTLTLARLPVRRDLVAAGLRKELGEHNPDHELVAHFRTAPAGDALAGMIATDVGVLLPDGFLTKVDRASMACGLEVRPPLVDHEFLELAAQVPSRFKVRDGQTKWLFKCAAARRLPADVVWRRKQGFDLPVDEWLRSSLAEQFRSTVLDPGSRAAELINQEAAGRLYQAHAARTGRHGRLLWALLVLARWAERYLPEPGNTHPTRNPPATTSGATRPKVCLAG